MNYCINYCEKEKRDEYCWKSYTVEEFRADLMKISSGRADEELVEIVVTQASSTAVEMQARYLGVGADSLILRGSKYNTGECLEPALAVGALPAGQRMANTFGGLKVDRLARVLSTQEWAIPGLYA